MHTSSSAACPPPDRLRDYLRGRTSDAEIESISVHLKTCRACLARIDRLDRSEAPLVRGGSTVLPEADDPALAQVVKRLIGPGGFPADPPADPLIPGDRLDEYRLLEQVGEGGMGTTYKALHARLEMIVALKVLRPPLTRDPSAVARFHREMRAIGRLRHPNIVQATDAGEARGLFYLVMEYLTGQTLSQRVRAHGALPVEDACRVIRSAARALQHAHENGLVHRDVKPSNLMQTADGSVKLLDLGLALLRSADSADPTQLSAERGVVGTNDYMAPEQWRNSSKVDARADQYSLGCTLYFLLAGEPPFARQSGVTHFEKMEAHLTRPAPDPSGSRPEVPPGLDAVVRRMLAKSPDDRFPTMADVIDALRPFAAEPDTPVTPYPPPPPPSSRSGRGWLVAAAALVAGIGLLAAFWRPLFGTTDPPTPPEPVVKVAPPPGRLPMTPDEAKSLQARWAEYIGRPVVERNAVGMDLVLIPPGEFEPARVSPVTLSQPFDLGRTEVTTGQFEQFLADPDSRGFRTAAEREGTGHIHADGNFVMKSGLTWKSPGTHKPTPDHPVVMVSWDDANAFCDWLTRKEKRKYRLPTEWEWQWACRAGSDQKYFHGSDVTELDRYAWHASNSGKTAVQPVGGRLPNTWGLADTLGNAHEWALNFRTTLPGERSVDPRGSPTGRYRTVCGGGYDTRAPSWQHRLILTPNVRWHKVGFRVLREALPPPELAGD
jgi:serine/threonine protein kinase/formylglycine-generating enzyme required for sulfatase activity